MPQDISSAEGRLFVSLTKQSDKSNRLVSVFPTREYLLQCLMASCYIPLYSMGIYGTPPEIDGELYIDGGYSNNLPIFDNIPTITHVRLEMQLANQNFKVNLNNVVRGAQALFPPSRAVLTAYFDMGFRNAMKFLLDNDFYEREEGNPLNSKELVSNSQLVCMPFKWLFNTVCKTRSSNIAELPFHVVSQHPTGDPTHAADTTGGVWNNWNENSFNHQEPSTMQPNNTSTPSTTSNAEQVDYFNEMQPKFKPPKKLHLQNVEPTVFVPETDDGELGDLDLDSIEWSATGRVSTDRTTSWSEDVDDNELAIDELAREQKRREREEKHKQRLQDHERRMNQKRSGGRASQQIGRLK
uniref:PNPLA domain-containing protein n=1 Tax=Ditylenchus dipsaci TaxID=166011 RepID=A0A915D6Y7_9BILA